MPFKDPAKKREYQARWMKRLREENPELINGRKRANRKRHPEKRRAELAKYRKRNPLAELVRKRRWVAKNRPLLNATERKRKDRVRYGEFSDAVRLVRLIRKQAKKEVKP